MAAAAPQQPAPPSTPQALQQAASAPLPPASDPQQLSPELRAFIVRSLLAPQSYRPPLPDEKSNNGALVVPKGTKS